MKTSRTLVLSTLFCLGGVALASAAPSQPSQNQIDATQRYYDQQRQNGGTDTNSTAPSSPSGNSKPATTTAPSAPSGPVGTADMSGNTPLHIAAYKGDTAKINDLLSASSTALNMPEKRGLTPLMLAAGNNHPNAVKLLLEKGANPNLKSKDGTTALHKASETGNLESVQALLKAGADPAAVDSHGRTPLQASEHYRQGDYAAVSDALKAAK